MEELPQSFETQKEVKSLACLWRDFSYDKSVQSDDPLYKSAHRVNTVIAWRSYSRNLFIKKFKVIACYGIDLKIRALALIRVKVLGRQPYIYLNFLSTDPTQFHATNAIRGTGARIIQFLKHRCINEGYSGIYVEPLETARIFFQKHEFVASTESQNRAMILDLMSPVSPVLHFFDPSSLLDEVDQLYATLPENLKPSFKSFRAKLLQMRKEEDELVTSVTLHSLAKQYMFDYQTTELIKPLVADHCLEAKVEVFQAVHTLPDKFRSAILKCARLFIDHKLPMAKLIPLLAGISRDRENICELAIDHFGTLSSSDEKIMMIQVTHLCVRKKLPSEINEVYKYASNLQGDITSAINQFSKTKTETRYQNYCSLFPYDERYYPQLREILDLKESESICQVADRYLPFCKDSLFDFLAILRAFSKMEMKYEKIAYLLDPESSFIKQYPKYTAAFLKLFDKIPEQKHSLAIAHIKKNSSKRGNELVWDLEKKFNTSS